MKIAWENITEWRNIGFITDLEHEFCRFLLEIDPEIQDEVLLAAANCMYLHRNGHLCLDLNHPNDVRFLFEEPETGYVLNKKTIDEWLRALDKSELVCSDDSLQPLVLEEGRLYLHRFWKYEEELCQWIRQKANNTYSLNQSLCFKNFCLPLKICLK